MAGENWNSPAALKLLMERAVQTAVATAVVAVYHRDDQTVTIHESDSNGRPGDARTGVAATAPTGPRHGVDLDDCLHRAGYVRTGRWTRNVAGHLTAPAEAQR